MKRMKLLPTNDKVALAAELGDVKKLKKYDKRGVQWHAPVNSAGQTPLMIAKHYGNHKAIEYLERVMHLKPTMSQEESIELSDEDRKDIRKIFDVLDLNGDGEVSWEEMTEALKRNTSFSFRPQVQRRVNLIFSKTDVNGDARLSFDEFLRIFQAPELGNIRDVLRKAGESSPDSQFHVRVLAHTREVYNRVRDPSGLVALPTLRRALMDHAVNEEELEEERDEEGGRGTMSLKDSLLAVAQLMENGDDKANYTWDTVKDAVVQRVAPKRSILRRATHIFNQEKPAESSPAPPALIDTSNLSFEEAREAMEELFRSLDENGDGTLTMTELHHALQSDTSNIKWEGTTAELFDLFDSNRDGRISLEEMLGTLDEPKTSKGGLLSRLKRNKAHKPAPAPSQPGFLTTSNSLKDKSLEEIEVEMKRIFDEIDEDTSGSITLQELEQYLCGEQSGFEWDGSAVDLLKRLDVNGDGVVSWEELRQAILVPETKAGLKSLFSKAKKTVSKLKDRVAQSQLTPRFRKRQIVVSSSGPQIGTLEVHCLELRGVPSSVVQLHLSCEDCHRATPDMGSEGGRVSPLTLVKRAERFFNFPVRDITGDLILTLTSPGMLKGRDSLGRVIVPLTQLCGPVKPLPPAECWFEIFPMPAEHQPTDHFCPGIPGVQGSAMERSKHGPVFVKLFLHLTLRMPLLKAYLVSVPAVRHLEDEAPSGDEDGFDGGGESKFNPRVMKQNIQRLKAIAANRPALVYLLLSFPFSLLLFPIGAYFFYFFSSWQIPLIFLATVTVNGVLAHATLSRRFKWLILWSDEIAKKKRANPLAVIKQGQRVMFQAQTLLGNIATKLEEARNALNFTDPRVTILILLVLGPLLVLLSFLLLVVPPSYFLAAVYLLAVIRLNVKGLFQWLYRLMNPDALSLDEVEQLRVLFNDMDENGDGTVSLTELNDYLRRKGGAESGLLLTKVSSALAVADEDGDGELSWKEFKHAMGVGSTATFQSLKTKVKQRAKKEEATRKESQKKQLSRDQSKHDVENPRVRKRQVSRASWWKRYARHFSARIPDEPESAHRFIAQMQWRSDEYVRLTLGEELNGPGKQEGGGDVELGDGDGGEGASHVHAADGVARSGDYMKLA